MADLRYRTRRLMVVIAISLSFFVTEISVGFYTRSLALVADAFHYLNDIVGFVVALVALKISQQSKYPKELSFGWQRAQLLGAFFNGVFLLALGVSIFLQSVERFVALQHIENPKLMLIVGCVGLALNIISAVFLHEHDHDEKKANTSPPVEVADESQLGIPLPVLMLRPHIEHRHKVILPKSKTRDLGMMGVLIHVLGDAVNNVGVIIAALVIWRTSNPVRYYADPAVSMAIAIMILLSSLPLVKMSGAILLECVPRGVDLEDIKHDLETIPGVLAVHELHVWSLNQQKSLASAHVVISDADLTTFVATAKIINECFHAYDIHSATLQPELAPPSYSAIVSEATSVVDPKAHGEVVSSATSSSRRVDGNENDMPGQVCRPREAESSVPVCQINCGAGACEEFTCCG